MRLFWFCLFLCCFLQTTAQEQDTSGFGDFNPNEFANYGDSENAKRFCNQKIRFQSPAKLISLGYEVQGPFSIESKWNQDQGNTVLPVETSQIQMVHGLTLGANFPVISRNSLILNLGINHQESNFLFKDTPANAFQRNLQLNGLRTTGVGFTVFKPLNEKHFLIITGNADANHNFSFRQKRYDFSKTLTYSGAALFGWKKGDHRMIGVGVTRTYRGGELLYVPVFLYNKTFNDKWGTEILLPARAHIRRTFSPKSLLMAGYELIGNSYFVRNDQTGDNPLQRFEEMHLRRSEIKLRMVYERSLKNFIWISVQAGLRYNYKFDVSESLDTKSGDFLILNRIGNPFYCNVSVNLVSP